jgi:hypothetical protein
MTNRLRILIAFAFAFSFSFNFFGQVSDDIELENTIKEEGKKDKIKEGWNFGGLPVISYDSDLGLQLGALVNAYDYGDGSRYPVYDQSIYLEGSWFLKGSGIFRFNYDSDRLIKGIRTMADISYLPDQTYKFFGFNGYESIYNQDWENDESADYKSRVYYRYKRQFFRAKFDFQGNIIGSKFRWLAGLDFYSIAISPVDINHLNDGKPSDEQLPDTIGLYGQYVDWNIISANEADGGMFTAFKVGLVFDTRDNEPNPNRGIWSDIIFVSVPKITSNMDAGFYKLAITHRQYFTLIKNHLTFAYRLGLQVNVAGTTPFYAQELMFYSKMVGAYNEGLGGAKTIRGIQRNRVVGDGFVFGNFELRWKVVKFIWFNQNFYIALSGFYDTGRDIQYTNVQNIVENENIVYPEGESQADYFNFGAESFHNAVGAGLHIAMNQNFIVAVDYGRALNKQDGESGLYIGLNFLF